MTIAHRPIVTTALAVACSGLIAACGSSSSSHTTSTAVGSAAGARHAGFRLTASEQSCLKKKGVTLSFPGGAGQGGGGRFTKGGRPTGASAHHRPRGGSTPGHGSFSAQMTKRLAALKSCGVSFGGGGHGPGNGGPGSGGPAAG